MFLTKQGFSKFIGVLLINRNVIDYNLFALNFLSELVVLNIYVFQAGSFIRYLVL